MTASDDLFAAFVRRDPALQEQYDRLWAMTLHERIAAMRAGRLTYQQLCHWSAHRPDQVPRLSTGSGGTGEFEWIAIFEPSIAEVHDTPAPRSISRRR